MPKDENAKNTEKQLMSKKLTAQDAHFAAPAATEIPDVAAYQQACQRLIDNYSRANNNNLDNFQTPPCTVFNKSLIEKALKRYSRAAERNVLGNFQETIDSTLLIELIFATDREIEKIRRSVENRTTSDCLAVPILEIIHTIAIKKIGLRYPHVDFTTDESFLRVQMFLQNTQSVPLTVHGRDLDNRADVKPHLIYLKDGEKVEALRVHVVNRLLQYKDLNGNYEPVHTQDWISRPDIQDHNNNTAHDPDIHNTAATRNLTLTNQNINNFGVAGFAMSLGRELYATRHKLADTGEKGYFYHSSYLAGNDVLAAGCIMVNHGQLLYIDNMSGHYKPSLINLLNAIRALQTMGVKMEEVQVYDKSGRTFHNAKALLHHEGLMNKQFEFMHLLAPLARQIAAYETRTKKWYSQPSTESKQALIILSKHDGRDLLECAMYYAFYDDRHADSLTHNQDRILNQYKLKYGLRPLKYTSTLRTYLREALVSLVSIGLH